MLTQMFEGSSDGPFALGSTLLAVPTHAGFRRKVCRESASTSGFLNSRGAQLQSSTAYDDVPPCRSAIPVTFSARGDIGRRKASGSAVIGCALRPAPPPVFHSPVQRKLPSSPPSSPRSLYLVDAERSRSCDAAWKPKPDLPHSPSGQVRPPRGLGPCRRRDAGRPR